MTLWNAEEGREYVVQRISTEDEELNAFLFSLGCYSGQPVTVVAKRRSGCTIASVMKSLLRSHFWLANKISRCGFEKVRLLPPGAEHSKYV